MFDFRRHVERLQSDGCSLLVVFAALAVLGLSSAPAAAQDDTEGGAAASSGPAATSPSDDQYEFGPQDVVQVEVFGREGLSTTVTIDPAGRIQVPMLGTVDVAGRTPAELTDELTQRYQLLDPGIEEVLVSVARYGSRTLTILGQVGNPGTYGFRELPDLWEALLTAQGATDDAALGSVQIVRRDRRPDEPRTLRADLSRGIEDTPPGAVPELRPRDTIVVPALGGRLPEGDAFRILGAVGQPGNYSMMMAENLLDAIGVAGGTEPGADLRSVRLLRRTPLGSMAYEIDLEGYLHEANPPGGLALRPGDTITVPPEEGFVQRISEVLAPFLSVATVVVLIQRASN
ncbi:MAG TPA: polysaccharide biosynthesis/export family protein [Candidatus Krumholzibacteria bacterium]|nr:polysaccharide biosynthesis/export family protein [Candidatus Krumholzibacteria bacterium]